MIRSVLAARGFFRGFAFAKEKHAQAHQPPAAKEAKKVPHVAPKFQSKIVKVTYKQIPVYQFFTEAEMKQINAVESRISPGDQRKIKMLADAVLQLEHPTFLHYIVRTNPETYVLHPSKEYTPEELRAFVQKVRKVEIPKPEIKKPDPPKAAQPAKEAPKPADKGKPPADKGGHKGKK